MTTDQQVRLLMSLIKEDLPLVTAVPTIMYGATTSKDLIRLFGEPFTKTVVSANREKWIYTYTSGTTSAQS